MPLVSVIIPAFNAEATLPSTLHSAQAQSVRDCEFLIINDGSTDQTLQCARSLAQVDSRIRVLSQPNAGVAAARNSGLDLARGDYIQFLDADDLLCDDATETLLAAERRLSCGAAAGTFDIFSPVDGSLLLQEPPGEVLGLPQVLARNYVSSISQVVRRDRIGALRFDTSYACYEDQDFWIRLAERGVCWAVTRRHVARYRIVAGSLSKSVQVLSCAEDVYVRAAVRTGALTPEQLQIRLDEFTLGYATCAAILAESVEAGAKLFAAARNKPQITAASAAAAGHTQSVYALGRRPQVDLVAPGKLTLGPKLKAWWSVCVENGWMQPQDLPVAEKEFARLCVSSQRIAAAILACCDGDITLIGFGQNAQWFLKHDLGAPPVFIRDDRLDDHYGIELPRNVSPEPMTAPIPSGRCVVVTPTDDEVLASRFPGAFRWKLIRNQLADQSLAA